MFVLLVTASLLAAPVANVAPVMATPGGHLALAQGILSGPNSGDLVQVARSFAIAHRAELGLPITSTLGAPQTFSTRFGGSVHLPQLVDGLEVDGGKVVITFDLQGRIVRVASSVRAYTVSKIAWSFTGPQALRIAANEIERATTRRCCGTSSATGRSTRPPTGAASSRSMPGRPTTRRRRCTKGSPT